MIRFRRSMCMGNGCGGILGLRGRVHTHTLYRCRIESQRENYSENECKTPDPYCSVYDVVANKYALQYGSAGRSNFAMLAPTLSVTVYGISRGDTNLYPNVNTSSSALFSPREFSLRLKLGAKPMWGPGSLLTASAPSLVAPEVLSEAFSGRITLQIAAALCDSDSPRARRKEGRKRE